MAKSKNAVTLMLDSGAYSAWTKDQPIDLRRYIKFIKANYDYLSTYVVLDVLPAGHESLRTSQAVEDAAAQSFRNYEVMLDAGIDPIPVFHQGEDFKWLERMLKLGVKYVGLSTRKDLLVFERKQREWLDKCFSILPEDVRTHGFGITKIEYLKRYPFYTVDSTRWALVAAYGNILMPHIILDDEVRWDYARKYLEVHVSDVMRQVKAHHQNQHFDHLSPIMQDMVRLYVEEVLSLRMCDVRYFSHHRRYATLIWFERFRQTLKSYAHRPLRIMYATSVNNRSFAGALATATRNTQLLSYFELQKMPNEVFQHYVRYGEPMKRKRVQSPKVNWNNETFLNFRRAGLLKRMEIENDDQSLETSST